MQTTELQPIECVVRGASAQAFLYYDVIDDTGPQTYDLHFIGVEQGHLTAESYNLFDALGRLRVVLESLDCQVCCNGARYDAWASNRAKEMGGGERVYKTPLGRNRTNADLVPTLAPAERCDCVTVTAQLEHHIRWMRSAWGDDFVLRPPGSPGNQATTESRLHVNGDVHRIDPAAPHGERITLDMIVGTWKVDDQGRIVEPFIVNSHHRPRTT